MIRLGWADIKTSSPQPRSVRFVEFARTDSASQFERFLQPCPTTSRPRDIPAGNIRQRQTDLSPQSSLSKSLRGCGIGVTDRPNQADNDSLICFIGRHLGAVLERAHLRTRRHNCVSRMPKLDGFRKRASESYLPLNRLLRKILYRKYRAERRHLLGRDTTFVCYSSRE